jgi:hypothetical protein
MAANLFIDLLASVLQLNIIYVGSLELCIFTRGPCTSHYNDDQ